MSPGELANLLVHRRIALGYNVDEIAAETGIHAEAIRAWEAGLSLAQVSAWVAYIEHLGIELRVLPVAVRPHSV